MLRYAITDGRLGIGADQRVLAERCGALARSGVEFILIREKALTASELTVVSRAIVATVRECGLGTRVLVAGRADVAFAVGADGVHLGSGSGALRVDEARRVFPGAFVSVSCHSLAEVRRARQDEASAVLFAPVFGKWADCAEVVRGVGLSALGEACEVAEEMPVYALGGVTKVNAEECVRAGAAGVAGIRMFFERSVYA